jgi:hypothetical protein
MNNKFKELLVGSLLGDAHIGCFATGCFANKAFVSFEQSSKKRDYLLRYYLLQSTSEAEGGIPLMDQNIKELLRYKNRS